MVSKFLEKRIEIVMQEIPENPGNALELEYYLVESDSDYNEGINAGNEYGVEIMKKERGYIKESKMFKGIYASRETIENFIRKLVVNKVTPVTLSYILDDILGV